MIIAEKLLSDLHGVSRCFPNATASNDKFIDQQGILYYRLIILLLFWSKYFFKYVFKNNTLDIRLRQAAYAKALQEQIDEKKNLEELRRRKEKEEDEMIEERIRMQQEKVQNEVSNEQKIKQDWIAQV